jgi:nucleotide-binding universal stress UspA family protein
MRPAAYTRMRLAPQHALEITMPLFKKILLPVDGSNTSNKALDYALKLAQADQAEVRLIYCIDELSLLSSHEYSGEMVQLARENGHTILQAGMALASAAKVKADTRLMDRVGQRLGESVADAAGDWGADLIVLGTHGRRGIGRVLLGSGAEQVMRMSPVPVLMVRGFD